MFCINCGKELKDTARFCPFCGNKIETPAEKIKNENVSMPVTEEKAVTPAEKTAEPVKEKSPAAEQTTPAVQPVKEETVKTEQVKEQPKAEPAKKEETSKKEKPVREKAVKEPKPAKKGGKAAVIAAAAVAVAGAAIAVPFYIMPSMEYAKADRAMTEGRYAEAYEIFDGLKDFKDSGDRVHEALYADACEKMDTEDYIGAIGVFSAIPDYSDSSVLSKKCEFSIAQQQLAAGEYEKAAASFKALGDYSGAKEKHSEALFAYGDTLAENGDYLKAIEVTAAADTEGYEDKRVLYCIGAAENYYAEGDYDSAIEVLAPVAGSEIEGAPVSEFLNKYEYYKIVEKIEKGRATADDARTLAEKPYMDSPMKLMQLSFDLASEDLEDGDYHEAAVMFRNAGSYNNAAAQLKEAQYLLAGEYLKNGDIGNARNLYSVVGAYKDSVKQRNDVSAMGDGRHNGWNADCCAYLGSFAASEFKVGDTIKIKGIAGCDTNSPETAVFIVNITSDGSAFPPTMCSDLKKGDVFEAEFSAETAGEYEVKIILASTGHVLCGYKFEVED